MLTRMFRFCKTSICPTHPMLQDAGQQLLLDDVRLATLLHNLKLAGSPAATLERRVRVGSYVTLTSPDFSENIEVKLVEPTASRPQRNRISYLSPLGSTLLGLRPGSEVSILNGEDGISEWIIADVRQYAGDF